MTTVVKKKTAKQTVAPERTPAGILKELVRVLGLEHPLNWTDIGLAFSCFVVYALVSNGVYTILSNFSWFLADEQQSIGLDGGLINNGVLFWYFLYLVVLMPVIEEILFRGLFYGKLRDFTFSKVGNKLSILMSMILVSLLFALIHQHLNVRVDVFILSIILCGMREVTGTIYAGILLHIIKNGVAFYLVFLLK